MTDKHCLQSCTEMNPLLKESAVWSSDGKEEEEERADICHGVLSLIKNLTVSDLHK